jgi:hypothetical protein
MGQAKPPIGSKVRDFAGAPSLWLRMAGPERTFAPDSGDVADQMGVNPAATRTPGCTWADGSRGPCLAFDGTGQVVTPWTPGASFTWIVRVATTTYDANFGFVAGVAGLPAVFVQSGLGNAISYGETGQLTGVPVVDGLPHAIALRRAGDSIAGGYTLWVDGVRVAAADTSAFAPGPLALGLRPGTPTQAYTGTIGEFKGFDRALADAEIVREHRDPDWRLFAPRRAPAPAAPSYRPRPRPLQRLIGGHGLT